VRRFGRLNEPGLADYFDHIRLAAEA